ncbi:class I adenylate-forming enzyme family protein [Planomonospora venezuelensis]|uniref:Fatty-acyl-CoA synthase/long-chain acyl-CoA synthetase n=1 Tax=Planomonospora venezuelensis TaxID=1999 RepID=A0A841DAB8_PLAVE|nr:class I adenylate-forming enzyme family protein [Planomonospora venezuelensis]MBB5965617.1 fatty-acyl-CoA synthase/long-chain acyl-CoA synthetase [Planomonospora venezuelensis]GIN04958.1 long-chain-fatty-acid--CoA ligase [Planomonospora venezuelensis]
MARSPYGNYAYAILTAGALRTPDRVALTYCGTQSFTYEELNRVVNRRVHALAEAGVGPGRRVAALLNETLHVAEVYLAAAKLGAVTAALNPYWPVETLQAVVAASGATAFVYDSTVEQVVAQIRPELPGITTWIKVGGPGDDAVDLDALSTGAAEEEPVPGASGDDPLALYYTSGTTGLPKAVVHTHASALATAQIWLDVPRSEESVLGTGAIIWGIGFPALVGPALYAGMRLVLEQDWGPANFLKVVPRERVTHVSQIPSFYAALLGSDEHASADLSSLRVIMLGGEPLPAALLARMKERLPEAGVYCYYGQTEAPYTCFGRVDDGSTPLGSSGRARTGNAVRITGPDGRRLVGETGEINLAGPHRMAGYDGLPDKTAEVLRGEWYVGGDLGVLSADGNLTVLGRREDAVLKGGAWSQPSAIEEAAVALDDVAEAGAVGVPAHVEGADAAEQRILLAVVPRAGHSLDPSKLALALAESLPAHQRPDRIVVAEELPHFQDASGGPGKLLRREIREKYRHLIG